MTKKHPLFYFVPGWGFRASVLSHSPMIKLPWLGLDYFYHDDQSPMAICTNMSNTIPDSSSLVCWSLGGLIAILLAYLFPNKVRQIVFLSSQPCFISDDRWSGIPRNTADQFILAMQQDDNIKQIDFIRRVNFPNHDREGAAMLDRSFIARSNCSTETLLKQLLYLDLREVYRSLDIHIMHVIAGQDAVIRQNKEQLKSLQPTALMHHVRRAGHAGWLSHPVEYWHPILDFLQMRSSCQ